MVYRRRRELAMGRLFEALAVLAIVALVTIVVITVAPGFVGSSSETMPGGLAIGATVAEPSSLFWAVGGHAVKWANSSLSAQVNATPIEVIRFGGGGDTENATTGISYSNNGVGTQMGNPFAGFLTFCAWRHCQAIFSVAGEINDPAIAADTVRYVEQTLGYHPAYWSIGNEPQLWTHYNISWNNWQVTDHVAPTPAEYATTVQNYLIAMRAVDPTIKVIGIQSAAGGELGDPWFTALVKLDGPNLAAVAYHSYPASIQPEDGNVQSFLSNGYTYGFPNDYETTVGEVRSACRTCNIPVFVDEYNGALVGVDSAFVQSYPDVPVVGAAVARALELNVTQLSFFDLQSVANLSSFGMIAGNGAPRPTYELYSVFFDHLADEYIENTTLLAGPGDIAAVVGTNGTTESLFVSSANATVTLGLSLNGSGFPVGEAATVYTWNSLESTPVENSFSAGTLPSLWDVPPEGVLEIDVTR
jgi:hypothetical protein